MNSIKYSYSEAYNYTLVKCGKMSFDMVGLTVKQSQEVMAKSIAHQQRAEYLFSQQPSEFVNISQYKNKLLDMNNVERFINIAVCNIVVCAISQNYSISDASLLGNAVLEDDEATIVSLMPEGKLLARVKEAQQIILKSRVA